MKVTDIESKGFDIYEGDSKVFDSRYSLRKVRQLLRSVRGRSYRKVLFVLSDLYEVDEKLVTALVDLEASFERFLGLTMTQAGEDIFDGVVDYFVDVVNVLEGEKDEI